MIVEENNIQNLSLKDFEKKLKDKVVGLKNENEQAQQKIAQAEMEIKNLTQKNAAKTAELQKIQREANEYPIHDIIKTYETALELQQMLYVKRIQFEKLQHEYYQKKEFLDCIEDLLKDTTIIIDCTDKQSKINSNVELVRMLIEAQEDERYSLSRQMHDGPAQFLSNLILQSEIAMRLFELDQKKAKGELSLLNNSANETFKRIRSYIAYLKPMALNDFGLAPAIKKYIEDISHKQGIKILFKIIGKEKRYAKFEELLLFRIVQELIEKAQAYGQASLIDITYESTNQKILLTIEDDGMEFKDEVTLLSEDKSLRKIQSQIQLLGGNFKVEGKEGNGKIITIQTPEINENLS